MNLMLLTADQDRGPLRRGMATCSGPAPPPHLALLSTDSAGQERRAGTGSAVHLPSSRPGQFRAQAVLTLRRRAVGWHGARGCGSRAT